jgi:hypothetical protein
MLWGEGPHLTGIKKNTGTLIGASKEVGVEESTKTPKYVFLSLHYNAQKWLTNLLKMCQSSNILE